MIDSWNPLSIWLEVIAVQQRTNADLITILARRFEGRRLGLRVAGRRVQLVLHRVDVRGGADPYQVCVELRELSWEGWPLEAIRVVADEVRLRTFPSGHVVASGAWVDGRTSLRTAVALLDGYVPEWTLGLGGDGRVEARHRKYPAVRLSVEAVARDHRLQIELCGVRWKRVRLSLPSRLRLRRTVVLPDLPFGATVVEFRRRGDAVDFQVSISQISQALPLVPGWPADIG